MSEQGSGDSVAGSLDSSLPSPYRAFRPTLLGVAIAGAVFVWLLLDVRFSGPLRHFDQGVAATLLDIGVRDHSVLRHVGYALSQAGGRGTNLAWIAVICLVIAVRQRTLAPFAKAASASVLMVIAVYPVKEWLSRSYPADPQGDYFHAPGLLGGAFPSGHQANATLLGSVGAWIVFEHVRSRAVRLVVGWYALAAPLVSAIAVLLMGYHWLTDVFAGTCAGVILLAVVRWAWGSSWGLRVIRLLSFSARPTDAR